MLAVLHHVNELLYVHCFTSSLINKLIYFNKVTLAHFAQWLLIQHGGQIRGGKGRISCFLIG